MLFPHMGRVTATSSAMSGPPVRLWLASSREGGPAVQQVNRAWPFRTPQAGNGCGNTSKRLKAVPGDAPRLPGVPR